MPPHFRVSRTRIDRPKSIMQNSPHLPVMPGLGFSPPSLSPSFPSTTQKVTGTLFKPAATARGLFLCPQETPCIRPQIPKPRRPEPPAPFCALRSAPPPGNVFITNAGRTRLVDDGGFLQSGHSAGLRKRHRSLGGCRSDAQPLLINTPARSRGLFSFWEPPNAR